MEEDTADHEPIMDQSMTDDQLKIPYLDRADWGNTEPLAILSVEGGRFQLRGASQVVRMGRQLMPGSRTNRGERHPMYGKHHTPEARAKISAAGMGRKFSDESRAKMSAARKAFFERLREEAF